MKSNRIYSTTALSVTLTASLLLFPKIGFTEDFAISLAVWKPDRQKLVVKGTREEDVAVTVLNAYDPDQVLKQDSRSDRSVWRIAVKTPSPLPCRVLARSAQGQEMEMDVRNAPSNCSPKGSIEPENLAPLADAGRDQTLTLPVGKSTISFTLDGSDSSDPDGRVTQWTWSGTPDPSDIEAPTIDLEAGTFDFSLVVKDEKGATSSADSVAITVKRPIVGGDPHESIDSYDGPQTCIGCHETEALEMHGSVHYQQSGPTDFVTNIDLPAGERWNGKPGAGLTGVNTYCGTHLSSPRFTCAGCHVGNGRFPKSPDALLGLSEAGQQKELENIDCLMCHQEQYKRFPDPKGEFEQLTMVAQDAHGKPDPNATPIKRNGLYGIPVVDSDTGDFQFVPADPANPDLAGIPAALMKITAVEAAQTVHATTRKSCLNCHAGAGGRDGAKRGDFSSAWADDASLKMDMHMSKDGEGLVCADCHDAGNHQVRGRGLDLRPSDVPERFTCETGGCHTESPHDDYSSRNGARKDTHAKRVACQTCHIPTYAKGFETEVARNWEDPEYSPKACNGRGGYLPTESKGTNLTPTYDWFDGTSAVSYIGEPLAVVGQEPLDPPEATMLGMPAGSLAYVLGEPHGDVASAGAKLHPMKEHWSKMARHAESDTLVPQSTFDFFRSGSFEEAIRSGMRQTEGMKDDDEFDIVAVKTYQTINHGVEVEDNALGCGACHSSYNDGGPVRMDLKGKLGYQLKGNYASKGASSDTCTQCHSVESKKEGNYFSYIHDKHVSDKGKDCSVCHTFSRPERNLSTRIEWDD